MKLKKLKLKNFRSFKDEIEVEFEDLTAFVGKNDIGKSTILEALDIFFNDGKGVIKIDKDDINKDGLASGGIDIEISVIFDDLPTSIIIDSSNQTTLANEYLLNADGDLEIVKSFKNAGKAKVFIRSNHPSNPSCNELLQKKNVELKKLLDDEGISCTDRTKNAVIRSSIWSHFNTNLQLTDILLDVTVGDVKSIWTNLDSYLPQYSLFQSDRKNSDGDSEVQDPLKEAVKQILGDSALQQKLSEVAEEVSRKLQDVADRTLVKLNVLNSNAASALNPTIPIAESLKWPDVFKGVSIAGDENIPINKRGSGIKRLILISFFQAEAERRLQTSNASNIIYAIEEPETSQHTDHQKKLIDAFIGLANSVNTQIVITTHSSQVVKKLEFSHLRLIKEDSGGKSVNRVITSQLPYPSLNEINFTAFDELSEEYHNELYGWIELNGELQNYRSGKTQIPYTKQNRNSTTSNINVTQTDYIRHQIHHPENTLNPRFTESELGNSIELMRDFIENQMP